MQTHIPSLMLAATLASQTASAQIQGTSSPAAPAPDAPEKISDLYNKALAPFYHGVASGDPLPDGFIIWTRVTQEGRNKDSMVPVAWTVATDAAMTNVVANGNAKAFKSADFTVKIDVRGLLPGTTYFYSFTALDRDSIVGRTKTAPSGPVDQLKFAVVSCANYEWGYFSGYRKISERNDLDAVIHTGDYLYEYPDNDNYSSEKIRDERVLFPRKETVTLDQYRLRYATYHLDPNLRRVHRRHPFIVTWDDHEFANNAWRGGAENHQKKTEGSWKERKAAAKQAYFEWMPIREEGGQINRTLSYGPLMDLIMIDTRIQGRDRQLEDVNDPDLQDPDRSILGDSQKTWFKQELKDSTATWKIIGNQVIFSRFNVAFATGLDVAGGDFLQSQFLDLWDGYPEERHDLMKFIRQNDIPNTVILTGDIHASFAFDVADPSRKPRYNPKTGEGAVAVEFVTPSLSAANFDEEVGEFFTGQLEEEFNEGGDDNPNPHMKFADLDRHGYLVLSVSPEQVQGDFYYLKNILTPQTTEQWGAGFISRAGTHHLTKAKNPARAKTAPAIEPLPEEEF
ncbi:MAG: alkaline phosphatase D family protein [Verrucomicrobiota bacterium]